MNCDVVRLEAQRHIGNLMKLSGKVMKNQGLGSFERRPTDVIVTCYPKSGSTLIQQMCYQIVVASGGSSPLDPTGLEFTELVDVTPWIEVMDVLQLQPFESSPRILKSHMSISSFQPLACKHIVCVRNPLEVPASLLNFLFDAVVGDELVSEEVRAECVNVVMENFILGLPPGSRDALPIWHSQLKEALHSQRDDVLVLFYENVVQDLDGTVAKVANFMGCKLSETGTATVLSRCKRNYMAVDPKFKGIKEANVFQMKAVPNFTRPKNFIGFKKYQIRNDLKQRLEETNLLAFGLQTYQEILIMFSGHNSSEKYHELH